MAELSEAEMLRLMERFRIAFGRADRDELLAVTSDDFVWCQHFANSADERPTGHTIEGVDGFMKEIAWRKENWSEVRYENLEERATKDLLVQTFTVSGIEAGERFHANAVDLYPVRSGLITKKDTYWKYIK